MGNQSPRDIFSWLPLPFLFTLMCALVTLGVFYGRMTSQDDFMAKKIAEINSSQSDKDKATTSYVERLTRMEERMAILQSIMQRVEQKLERHDSYRPTSRQSTETNNYAK